METTFAHVNLQTAPRLGLVRIAARTYDRGRNVTRELEFANLQRLVAAVRLDEPGAGQSLVDKCEPIVARFAERRVAAVSSTMPLDAQDLRQAAMLRLWKRIDKIPCDNAAQFLSWLRTLVDNNANNLLRNARAAKRGGGRVRPLADFSTRWVSPSRIRGNQATPSQIARAHEIQSKLDAEVAKLTAREREIWNALQVDGLDNDSAARKLGIKKASLTAAHSRILGKLRRLFCR